MCWFEQTNLRFFLNINKFIILYFHINKLMSEKMRLSCGGIGEKALNL